MTVEQIQCLLTYLGYNPGAVDGVNGLKTAAAVLVFQQQEGLRQDGVPGPETQEALLSAVATGRMCTPVMGNQSPDWWGDIRYFKRDEFRCPCGRCGGFPVEPQESMVRTVDEFWGTLEESGCTAGAFMWIPGKDTLDGKVRK